MTLFRFYRPLQLDRETLELSPRPHGGVCILLHQQRDRFFPSWSICNDTELFSKPVARTIAIERLSVLLSSGVFDELGTLGSLRYMQRTDTQSVVDATLEWIENVIPHFESAGQKAYTTYLSQHLETVHQRLTDIKRQNSRLEAEKLGHHLLRGEPA